MTNDRLFGLFLRTITVPLILLVTGIGGYAMYSFWAREMVAKELYRWEPVRATSYAVVEVDTTGELEIAYLYNYQGTEYGGGAISPFTSLNRQAERNEKFRAWLTREDHPPLIVYVDPDKPLRSSIVRGWAQDDRIEGLFLGSGVLTIGLVLLYFSIRKVPKVEELL